MRTSTEILAEHSNEDDIDLQACIVEFEQQIKTSAHQLSLGDMYLINEQHIAWAVQYLGALVLSIAQELGVLPKGEDQERKNLALALTFDRMKRMNDMLAAKYETKLVVPGQ